MATGARRRDDLLSAAPKFFEIILDPLEHTLKIPPKFWRRYGHNLPNRVLLKVPRGSAMEVSLVRRNGETLLQNGWKEFKDRYSLVFGHFLIFKYNGKSQFDVMIYDMSATEINYPSDSDTEPQHHSTSSSREKGKAKIVEDSDSDINGRVQLQDSISDESRPRKQKKASEAYEKAKAYASAHKSSKPFFISQMRKSNVSRKSSLNVPKKFATENLHHKCNNLTLQLRNDNGKTWSVRCNITHGGRAKMYAFNPFVKDNELNEGDACIFEAAHDCVWNVLIFRN